MSTSGLTVPRTPPPPQIHNKYYVFYKTDKKIEIVLLTLEMQICDRGRMRAQGVLYTKMGTRASPHYTETLKAGICTKYSGSLVHWYTDTYT